MRGLACLAWAAAAAAVSPRPWLDASLPVSARVDALLAEMTTEEKVNQVLQLWTTVNGTGALATYGKTGVGAMYIFATAADAACGADRACRLEARNALQAAMVKTSRLGIPISFVSETLHSIMSPGPDAPAAPVPLSTVFPMPVTQGATWNRSLVEAVAAAVAKEARASGVERAFSPEVQVAVDPRFGRMEENFGADPALVSAYAAAATVGLGGGPAYADPNSYLRPDKLVAQAKHFAAYGAGAYDGAPADVSPQTLFNVFLRPWRAFVEAGGRGAMAGHNSVNAEPCHSSAYVLTALFRRELNCSQCFITSDFNDVPNLNNFGTADKNRYPGFSGNTDAAIQALEAGLDLDLGAFGYPALLAAVQKNLTDVRHLDRAAGNVLRSKFAAGLFDHVRVDPAGLAVVHSTPHVRLAREAATQGCVLLQNPPGVLPLRREGLTVALLGPNAGCGAARVTCDVSHNLIGGYSPTVLSDGQVVTLQDALDAELGMAYDFVRGVDVDSPSTAGIPAAVAAAARAGVGAAVLMLGDGAGTCGEGVDRMALDLPGKQLDLLEAVLKAVNGTKPVVAVVVNCRTFTFGEGANSKFGPDNALLKWQNLAVVAAGRPGEQAGPAVLDLLLGRAQPSGRLAQPFPRSAGHIHTWSAPWYHLRQGDYGWPDGRTPWGVVDGTFAPLWCFGHGLSYSVYNVSSFAGPHVVSASDAAFNVSVELTTAVAYPAAPAAFTVQIYYWVESRTRQVRPRLALAGWQRVAAEGASTHVTVPLAVRDFGYTVWNASSAAHAFVVEPGVYRLFACRSSCDCLANTTVTVSL